MDGRAPTRKFRICVHCARLDRGDECTPAEFAAELAALGCTTVDVRTMAPGSASTLP